MLIAVRAARLTDIPAITGIYAHAVREATATFELDPPDIAEMNRRMEHLFNGGYPYIVAEQNNELVGYAYAGPYHHRPAYRFTVEDSIYIAPAMHRRGVGRRLLAELIALSEARGYRQMIAVIGDSANTRSIGLHTTMGFRIAGKFESVGFKFGKWLDSVLMQRALGDGATNSSPESSAGES